MKLLIPQHPDHQRVMMEVTGPGFLVHIKASTELGEIERHFEVDDDLLSVRAWFVSNAGEPVGEEFVLKEATREPEEHKRKLDVIEDAKSRGIELVQEFAKLDDIAEVQTVRFAEEDEPAVEYHGPTILLEEDDEDDEDSALEAPVEDRGEEVEADAEEDDE